MMNNPNDTSGERGGGSLKRVVMARRAWAIVDHLGRVKLESIRNTRQESMTTTLTAYLCADPIETIRQWAEDELKQHGWRCIEIGIAP